VDNLDFTNDVFGMFMSKTSSRIPAGVALTLNALQGQSVRPDIRGLRFDPNVRFVAPSLLQPNPLNIQLFDDEPEEAVQALADDIRENGIHDALLAKPDNTLLTGHNRLKAALRLGLERVPVRYLLDTLDAQAEARFMVADNLLRRHLSTEQKIKLYQYLYGQDFLQSMAKHGGKRKEISTSEGQVEELNLNKLPISPNGKAQFLTAERIARDTGQTTSAVQRQLYDWRKKSSSATATGTANPSTQKKPLQKPLQVQYERTAAGIIRSSLDEITVQLQRTDVSDEWKESMRQTVERRLRRMLEG
jgi:ParB-like chromosome segregation protein Spo0J